MRATRFEIIDTTSGLHQLASQLARFSRVAVDLEADSLYHYREKVCLVQIAAGPLHAVVDTIRVPNLDSLKPLFADNGVQKIFHGADYDVRSLYRDFGITIANLFDTQLASIYLGERETGLEAVLGKRYKIRLDKRFQKKDWTQRPLPKEMVEYAAMDVAHLVPLSDQLTAELKATQRMAWVAEECQILSQARPASTNRGPLYLKFKGAGRLSPRHLAALEALLRYRKATARRKDKPLFKIFSNASLLKIAMNMPKDTAELEVSGVLSAKQLRMYRRGILGCIQKARQIPDISLPHYPRSKAPVIHARVPERIRRIRVWRDAHARRLALEPPLLLNKALMGAIAVKNPNNMAELEAVESLRKWQLDEFGPAILGALTRRPHMVKEP
jgi:ribonuclease D